MKFQRILKQNHSTLLAAFLLLILCFASYHEASGAHASDKNADDNCTVCSVLHSIHSTDLAPNVVLPAAELIEAAPYVAPTNIQSFVFKIFQINASARAPPV